MKTLSLPNAKKKPRNKAIFWAIAASVIIHIIILNLFFKPYYIRNKQIINKKNKIEKSILLSTSEYIQKKETLATPPKKIIKPKPIKQPVKKKKKKTEPKKPKTPDNSFNKIKRTPQTTDQPETFNSENSGQTKKNTAQNAPANNKQQLKQTPPVYKHTPAPPYPKLAKKRGRQGTAIINALIDINGKVKEINISKTSGYQTLDNAAIKAVKKWLFIPAAIGNKKIEMRVRIPVKFEISD
ncbi:MAG: energy transducer TonB [Deltaproteobacteria bacterium]|nr:energy transducer TonB [Deltaproteobacteria bacterium]